LKPATINDLVDQLLARDGSYQPLELLLLLRRVDRNGIARWASEPNRLLEDYIYGSIEAVIEQLNWAADRAQALGLEAQTETRQSGQGACFRRSTADQQSRTSWRRNSASAQSDLFFDNRLSLARAQLVRALTSADRSQAEAALLELSNADPGNELQVDAEHLVGALGWLESDDLMDSQQSAELLEALEGDLAFRAQRLLGRNDSDQFLARFFSWLADQTTDQPPNAANGQATNAASPVLLRFKANDMPGALDEIDKLPHACLSIELRLIELRASLSTQQRDRALIALSRLCWVDPEAAESWLELGEDDELARRIEQFWDLEDALPISLFPAWLLARGYPVPAILLPADDPVADGIAVRALEEIRAVRAEPANIDARQWLQEHCPALLAQWMGQR